MAKTRKDPKQIPLFELDTDGTLGPPVTARPPLTVQSSLASAIGEWEDWMERKKMSPHTIKSFRSDLNLLARFHGRAKPIGGIGTKELQAFLTYLREGRDAPCSPKSYQRRVTSLKSFFKWLHDDEIIPHDPAAPIIHLPVRTPLPEILYDDEVAAMLTSAEAIRNDPENPDVRPYLLFTLVLKTGMKKGEVMKIALEHLDLNNPDGPTVYVRYSNPRYALKERKLALPEDFPAPFHEYVEQYAPKQYLFECTPRNLEYVLQGLADEAGVKNVSFEILRMTSAVHDYRSGMDPDQLRRKMGLSEITWRETGAKIAKLAEPPL
ncbi:MAG: phage integrase N-terminal SAM-like domain-containing protein [Chloroflexota bacterium]|nr:phage integrase N-terminal SAM-like domain-containing protein [Chloroflexota bacterium]